MTISTLNCLNNIKCGALVCDKNISCSTCYSHSIKRLVFPEVETRVYLRRRLVRLNILINLATMVTDETVAIPSGLMPGDVIYLRVTLLKYDNLYIELTEDTSNVNYEFRARCNPDQCSSTGTCSGSECNLKYVTINSKTNGQWSNAPYTSQEYPFILNEEFKIYFLVKQDSVDVFVKEQLFCSYKTQRQPENIREISIRGTVVVHELSL
ncbi:galectin-related protein precursor [Biomphalaria glabrata]|nr:galectin-related protein precursor [Biomphalaria glabrata]